MNNIYSNMLKVAVLGAQAAHAVHLAASLRDCDTEANLVCRLWRKDDFSGDSYDICQRDVEREGGIINVAELFGTTDTKFKSWRCKDQSK